MEQCDETSKGGIGHADNDTWPVVIASNTKPTSFFTSRIISWICHSWTILTFQVYMELTRTLVCDRTQTMYDVQSYDFSNDKNPPLTLQTTESEAHSYPKAI
jgi:hypothetical protein